MPEADPGVGGVAGQVGVVVDLVPRDVEGDARRDAGEPVDLGGVGDLLVRVVRGTPFWAKTLKRVPELPNAHDGSSIRWARSAATTAWLVADHVCLRRPSGGCPSRSARYASAVIDRLARLDRARRRSWRPATAAGSGRRGRRPDGGAARAVAT